MSLAYTAAMRFVPLLFALMIAACNGGGNTARGPASLLGAQPRLLLRPDGGVPPVDAGFEEFAVWVATAATPDSILVHCDQIECTVTERIAHPAATAGVFALVVDDSGSNTVDSSVCVGCPTDPDGVRKAAAKTFFRTLFSGGGQYRGALFDFGPAQANASLLSTRMIAGYTRYPENLVTGADQLKSAGGTYIYDSVWDVAPTLAGEALALDAGSEVARHLLIVSDGEDTNSTKNLTTAVTKAASLGVVVDTIGYGRSDGGTIPLLVGKAFRDLRVIAAATGGFCTFTQTSELPVLLEATAESYLAGSVELRVRVPPPGLSSLSGTVSAEGRSLPFRF